MSLYEEYDAEKLRTAGSRLLLHSIETTRAVGTKIAEHLNTHFGPTPRPTRPQLVADMAESRSSPTKDDCS